MTESPDTPLTPEPADDGGAEQHEDRPDLIAPRGNPPVDEEALEKGQDQMNRVKPY
jgi:hypothetical protein